MEIKVTLYEFEEAKQSLTVMKPQEVDYIASFYRAAREVAELRRHIADIGEAMRTKANNNPDGVKASTLEMLGEELLAALHSNTAFNGDRPYGRRVKAALCNRRRIEMKAWTDYPFTWLGDTAGEEAPVREIEVMSYDDNKYCRVGGRLP